MTDGSPVANPGIELAQLLRTAVDAFTAAARVTQWPLRRGPDGHLEVDRSGAAQRLNWSEFVCAALAGAAANMGGTQELLAGRPAAPEDQHIAALLLQTIGPGDEDLECHRTEPLAITLYVRTIVSDLAYELAQADGATEAGIDRLEAHLDLDGLQRGGPTPSPWTTDCPSSRILRPLGEDMKGYLLSGNTLCHCPITVDIELFAKPTGRLFGGASDTLTASLVRAAADESAQPWLAARWAEAQRQV